MRRASHGPDRGVSVENVIPHVPVRQWVLSQSIPLHLLLAAQEAIEAAKERLKTFSSDLEAAAVVQIKEFGCEQAHGVHVQVAPTVADADAPGARRLAAVQSLGCRLGRSFVNEALCGRQLQGGVVRQTHNRRQRRAHEELIGRDLTHRRIAQPCALLLADVHAARDDVGLRRLQQQQLAH